MSHVIHHDAATNTWTQSPPPKTYMHNQCGTHHTWHECVIGKYVCTCRPALPVRVKDTHPRRKGAVKDQSTNIGGVGGEMHAGAAPHALSVEDDVMWLLVVRGAQVVVYELCGDVHGGESMVCDCSGASLPRTAMSSSVLLAVGDPVLSPYPE